MSLMTALQFNMICKPDTEADTKIMLSAYRMKQTWWSSIEQPWPRLQYLTINKSTKNIKQRRGNSTVLAHTASYYKAGTPIWLQRFEYQLIQTCWERLQRISYAAVVFNSILQQL